MKEMKPNVEYFLLNEDFIKWRLFRSEALEKQWEQYLLQYPHYKITLEEAISRFEAVQINRYRFSDEDKQEVYSRVLGAISRREKRWRLNFIYSIAATLLIGVVLTVYFTLYKGSESLPFVESEGIIMGQTLPQEEVYLLSEGNRTGLDNHTRIDVLGEGKAVVTDKNAQKELSLSETDQNQLVVPYGKRSNIILSDGTEVWVNSGTRLTFPTRFNGGTRTIHVDGEIFIQVAQNADIPFIVQVQGAEIQVHGTSFNISAYTDEEKKTIVLVEGKVTIKTEENKSAQMLPNEKIDIVQGELAKEVVNVTEYISWRNGILEFNRTPMSEILRKVGRYYNVHFEEAQEVELNAQTFSGKLFLSNNLDSVMTSVSVLSSTKYERNDNLIQISKK